MPHSTAKPPEISVERFVEVGAERMGLSILAGEKSLASRFLDSARVQKLGLALSGFTHRMHGGRIQIFGNSEAHFMSGLDSESARLAVDRLVDANISCILFTASNALPSEILRFAEQNGTPILSTPLQSSEAIGSIADILGYELSPTRTVHGVSMEVFGIGLLITGESGIGKSECALDLIGRGHRLVSDDAVFLRRIGDRIIGEAPEIIRDHLEIRGLGIINARELFGVSALSEKANVELCIEFVGDDAGVEIDRLGADTDSAEIIGVRIARYVLPVRPGRNLATLAETAVRVFVSRRAINQPAMPVLSNLNKAAGGV